MMKWICICLSVFFVSMSVSESFKYYYQHEQAKADLPQRKTLTYDQQHLMCYDFMIDNPHVRQAVCEKKFMQVPIDSDKEQ